MRIERGSWSIGENTLKNSEGFIKWFSFARLTADVQDFKSCFKQCVSQGLRSIAQLIGGGVSLFMISPQMAGIAMVSVPVAVLVMSMLGGALRSLSRRSQAQNEKATSVCEEALSNIRTVRSSACEFAETELFERETNEAANLSQQLGVGIAVFQALTNLFLNGYVIWIREKVLSHKIL